MKGNLTAKNTKKTAPDPAEGAYSAPTNPLVGGRGWLSPPQEPHPPTLGPSGLTSSTHHSKISSDAIVTWPNFAHFSYPGQYAGQASEHIFSLTVAHTTAMLSRQPNVRGYKIMVITLTLVLISKINLW